MPLDDYAEHELITANRRGSGRGMSMILTEVGLEELDNMYAELYNTFDGTFNIEDHGLTAWEQEFMEDYFNRFVKYYEKYGKNAIVFCSSKQLQVLYKIDKKIFGE